MDGATPLMKRAGGAFLQGLQLVLADASVAFSKENYSKAIPLYETCMIELEQINGEGIEENIRYIKEMLAICYLNVGKPALKGASTAFSKGEYAAAISLYEVCIIELMLIHGNLSVKIFPVIEKLALCCSIANEYSKAIRTSEDRFNKMSLFYGELYPATLSSLFCLAQEYSKEENFITEALSLHEDCFAKRRLVLGDTHEGTLESISALSSLKLKQRSIKIQRSLTESLFNDMKVKDLLELIVRRGLNREFLQEKRELVHLLASNIPEVERRGVTLKLFQSFRKLALSRNSDVSYWTIARVSAIINGNHEILKPDCRFGAIDPASTLTYAHKCSLIDVLLSRHFDSMNKHPVLDVSYKEAVGEKANFFLSFAYSDNFIELVDALELYIESNNLSVASTSFWFDLFINDQWAASSKGFDWWANAFFVTVNSIGHTLTFLSPWNDPSYLTRVWCLLEMRYSQRVSLILSRKEVASFHKEIRISGFNQSVHSKGITESLCRIKVENATSHEPEDRDRIFDVIRSMRGGIDGFNNEVMVLIRAWVADTAKLLISDQNDHKTSENLSDSNFDCKLGALKDVTDLHNVAFLLLEQGKLVEAKAMFERVISIEEQSYGLNHVRTMITYHNLGLVLLDLGKYEEARLIFEKVLEVFEKDCGPNDAQTLKSLNCLGISLQNLGKYADAEAPLDKALKGRERTLGPDHEDTLRSYMILGQTLMKDKKYLEAERMLERALRGQEKNLGLDHHDTLSTISDLASVHEKLGKVSKAEIFYEKALKGMERTLGSNHPNTIRNFLLNGRFFESQRRLQKAKEMYEKALKSMDNIYGTDDERTLEAVISLQKLLMEKLPENLNGSNSLSPEYEDLKKILERMLRTYEKTRGPVAKDTLNAASSLAQVLQKLERFEEARLLFERVLRGFESNSQEFADENIATAANNLGSLIKWQGAHAQMRGDARKTRGYFLEAKLHFERALKLTEKCYGPDHETVVTVLCNLGQLLMSLGQFDRNYLHEAKTMLGRALKWQETNDPDPDNPRALDTLGCYAMLLQMQGNMREAKPLLQRAHEKSKRILGPFSQLTMTLKQSLDRMP